MEAGGLHLIGPDLVFGRLWKELGLGTTLNRLLMDRGFEFPVERAVYLTVLHRLPVADRARGVHTREHPSRHDPLQLHHLYGAMRWLGDKRQAVEEALFQRRHDYMFTQSALAFFDTTSLYFEGQGGESLGQFGYSKDHRPNPPPGSARRCAAS